MNLKLSAYLARKLAGGATFGLGLVLVVSLSALLAQSMDSFNSGDVISSASINKNFQIAAPEGAVMAFYLSSCPDGWLAADGTNSTPDLRGYFIRGRDPGNATGRDPDGARAIGATQTDAFQGHYHNFLMDNGGGTGGPEYFLQNVPGYNALGGNSLTSVRGATSDGTNGTPRTADESRPENVALTYCMRKDS